MILDYEGLKAALGRLSQGTSAHSDLLFVVRISRGVVEAYLRVKVHSLRYLYADQGLTETDLAYDCIAEVFRADGERRYPKVERFAGSLSRPFADTPAVEVFVAWRRFLTLVAKGRIAEIFHLADPVGGRIHRNLRDCVKRFTDLRVIDTPSGCYICIDPPRDSPDGTAYPADALEQELAARGAREGNTARLLAHVRDLLAADHRYGGRIRLFELVQILKRRFGADLADSSEASVPAVEGLTEADILALRERCLGSVKEKIFLTYLGKGKLSRREVTALFDTVAGVVDDWISGSDGDRSLADRMGDHLPIGDGEYASRYRAKLEYLVKAARQEFAGLLSRDI